MVVVGLSLKKEVKLSKATKQMNEAMKIALIDWIINYSCC